MSLLIGIQESEHIRYIQVDGYDRDFEKIVAKLLNFYKTTEKVKALIDLGNLEWLGASPYRKNKGDDDIINCESKIRDRKLSAGKHGACIVKTEKEFVKKMMQEKYGMFHCCFLFECDMWYILVGAQKERLDYIDESFLDKDKLMDGLKVYDYIPDSQYDKRLSERYFQSWDEVKIAANENNKPYFIFRGTKLLTPIYPTTQTV